MNDRPVLGIGLMIAFCMLAPLADGIAKILGQTIPVGQLVLVRFAMQALLLLPIVWWMGKSLRLSPRLFQLTALRTVLHVIGIGAMFTSLRFLPLADAVAIAFVMPFIMLLLGRYFLDEEVGKRRIVACAIGFVGTLFVIKPSFATVGWPALLPLVVAVVFAFFILITRQIAKQVDPISLQAISGLLALPLLLGLLALGFIVDWHPLSVIAPSAYEGWLLVTIGVLGTFAHLLMTWSLRFAPAATLAPMQYLEIPFAALIGWLVFRDLPDGLALFGIAITIGAGLYIIHRERIASA